MYAPLSPTMHLNSDSVIWKLIVFQSQYSDYDCPDGDDGLDPDIELEMEAFIDEIEEHLLMQDFDPDLQHMWCIYVTHLSMHSINIMFVWCIIH